MPCRGFLGNGAGSNFHGYFGGGMFFMMGLSLIIFIVIIYFIFKAIKGNSFNHFAAAHNTPFTQNNSSALNILNERFAKGEISEEEYTKMKSILNNKN